MHYQSGSLRRLLAPLVAQAALLILVGCGDDASKPPVGGVQPDLQATPGQPDQGGENGGSFTASSTKAQGGSSSQNIPTGTGGSAVAAKPAQGNDTQGGSGSTDPVQTGGDLQDAGVPNVDPIAEMTGSEADYRDPGTGKWEEGTPEECGMDISKLDDGRVGNYAVFRRGKLCHMKGGDGAGSMFSATKTLGGAMIGRAAYLTRDVPRTGPGTGTIMNDDKAVDWLGSVSYNREATLAHAMSMCGHSTSLEYGSKRFTYDTVGSTQINTMIQVTTKAIAQVDGLPTGAVQFVKQEIFDRLGMSSSRWSPALGISSGWTANLSDMGKLGTLLVHDGWYNGERLLSREWVYRMSHPAFEDANTSYGQLAWLNHRGNAAGIGGNITTGSNARLGDPCAPAAFWPRYPHGSGAPDCRPEVGTCEQAFDVGIFSAQGLGGQFLVMHPGLDLVIAARNFSGGDGPLGLWEAIRPAIVAADPMFNGDEEAFCEAYGGGNYAPDLIMRRAPIGIAIADAATK